MNIFEVMFDNCNEFDIFPFYKLFDKLKYLVEEILESIRLSNDDKWNKIYFCNPLFIEIEQYPLLIDFFNVLGYNIHILNDVNDVYFEKSDNFDRNVFKSILNITIDTIDKFKQIMIDKTLEMKFNCSKLQKTQSVELYNFQYLCFL